MKTETFTAPAFLAPALINGDTSNIDDSPEDLELLDEVTTYLTATYGNACPVDCQEFGFLGVGAGDFGRLAGDYCIYTMLVRENDNATKGKASPHHREL